MQQGGVSCKRAKESVWEGIFFKLDVCSQTV